EYLLGWSSESGSREYFDVHRARLLKTLEITPPGEPGQSVLEMGAYFQITPALKTRLGYEEVRGCYYGAAGTTEHRKAVSLEGEEFECDLELFDAEKDIFPYPNETFSTVLCCELLEHLFEDPMHMMSEINRILKVGGHLVLTTPNICSLRAIAAILTGYHPGFFPAYILPKEGEEPDPRHNREYAPREIAMLLTDAGFEVKRLETGPFRDAPRPELGWVSHLLEYHSLPGELRGDGIYAVGRKSGPVRERYPEWLYSGGG
ncbi:MAG TPA: methyltransferase domain-containing protein, partial [Bryobacteraceae bacterium]|nr:methyltransferase domain-containing protein [Bryobacteraceae bacterium]